MRSEAIARLKACVDELCDMGVADLDGRDAAEQLLALDALAGRIGALEARLVPVVEGDGWWSVDGHRSIASWLAARGRMSYVRARGIVRLGRAFATDLPLTAAATESGALPIDHATTLARHTTTSKARRDALADDESGCGEEFLVEHGQQFCAETFARLIKGWAAAADPESDERGYTKATDREFVTLAETTDGMFLRGFLTMEHGSALRAALEAVMVPPAKDDTRTTAQRRGQALADLARLSLDHGLVGTGADVRPHLSCVVDFDSLRRAVDRAYRDPATAGESSGVDDGPWPGSRFRSGKGPVSDARPQTGLARTAPHRLTPVADVERFAVAQLLGAGTVPASVLARLACDSALTRVVFGPESQVIDAGRAERTFSGPRRRAIISRDQTCRYPTCTAPPALGELHHVEHWARGGSTDTNAGILLCWHHHDLVHRQHISISRSPTGGWTFTTRDGTELPRAA